MEDHVRSVRAELFSLALSHRVSVRCSGIPALSGSHAPASGSSVHAPRPRPFGYLTVVYSPKALTIAVRFSTQLMGVESRMVGDLVWNVALP